ncbi:TRAP transporter small permease [Paracoccus halophilus]|nr:TRAP transporter small permease [Paracoccus halophilus]
MAKALMWVSGICLVAMMLHVCLDVAAKNMTGRPVPGTAEIVARYYMLAAVFLPLPLVELRNNAIVVDLFYDMFGPAVQKLCMVIAYLGQTAFFGLLAYRSFWDAIDSYHKGEFVDGQVPIIVWPAAFFLPFGFALAFLVSLLRVGQVLTRNDWRGIVAPHPSDDAVPGQQEGI